MYASSILRAIVFFTSVTSLPLFASAAPINIMEFHPDGAIVQRTVDSRDAYAGRTNGTGRWFKEHSFDDHKNGALVRREKTKYNVDCNVTPEICANICYYHYCKKGSLEMTKDGVRKEVKACSESPNKCSQLRKNPPGRYPHEKYQCDEFPLASTKEGGKDSAATRCVPGRQNSIAGGGFSHIPVGTVVETTLLNPSKASFYCDGKCDTTADHDGRQA